MGHVPKAHENLLKIKSLLSCGMKISTNQFLLPNRNTTTTLSFSLRILVLDSKNPLQIKTYFPLYQSQIRIVKTSGTV